MSTISRGRNADPLSTPPPKKTRITIRLDGDVLEWFRTQADAAGGANYQTLINKALRKVMEARQHPLEEAIRRVIREELEAYGD